jgi:hypothetical protein
MIDIIHNLPAEDYYGKPLHYGMSQLLDFEKWGPLAFRDLHHEPVEPANDDDAPALRLGRAYHTYILEGQEEFENGWIVVNKKPKAGSKAYDEWKEMVQNNWVTRDEMDLILRMHDALINNPLAASILDGIEPEVTLREEKIGWTFQSRLDGLSETYIVELKGCGDIDRFRYDFHKYSYDRKAAAYIDMCRKAGLAQEYIIVCVEKTQFPRVQCFRVGESTLAKCSTLNEQLFRDVTTAINLDEWPRELVYRPITTLGE